MLFWYIEHPQWLEKFLTVLLMYLIEALPGTQKKFYVEKIKPGQPVKVRSFQF